MADSKLLMTVESFKQLQQSYNKAVKDRAEEFVFQDKAILTNYAKYLIEYLTPFFKTKQQ